MCGHVLLRVYKLLLGFRMKDATRFIRGDVPQENV